MDFSDHYANFRFFTYQASLPDCLIFGAGSKILLRQIRHHFPAWYQAMPDRSGTCQIKIRRQPDWSGCCLIKIRQLPDRSGTCQIKLRRQPDRSGCCLIKIRHAWYQANLSAWSILLRQIRWSGKRRKFVRSLVPGRSSRAAKILNIGQPCQQR